MWKNTINDNTCMHPRLTYFEPMERHSDTFLYGFWVVRYWTSLWTETNETHRILRRDGHRGNIRSRLQKDEFGTGPLGPYWRRVFSTVSLERWSLSVSLNYKFLGTSFLRITILYFLSNLQIRRCKFSICECGIPDGNNWSNSTHR